MDALLHRPAVRLVVIVGLTPRCGAYGEVIVDGSARSHIRDSDLKAVSYHAGHIVPARGKAPGPVEIFTGRKGDFYSTVSVGRRGGIGHGRTIGHNRVGGVTRLATGGHTGAGSARRHR